MLHYDATQSALNQLCSHTTPGDVRIHLDAVKNNLAEMTVINETLVQSITIQSLLHIGVCSNLHFLDAVERYITVLHALSRMPPSVLSP